MGIRSHGRHYLSVDKRTYMDEVNGVWSLVVRGVTVMSATAAGVLSSAASGSLVPATDDTYDLGTSAAQWKDGYFDGNLETDALSLNGTAVSATAAELNYLDLTTLGTGAASKAVVLDAGDDYTWPATGIFTTGEVREVGKRMVRSPAPAAKTVTNAISAAQLITGIITTTGATAPSEHQLPTGTLLTAEFPGVGADMAFDFFLINTGVGVFDDAILTVNTDVTIVGNPTVGALTDATIISGSGHFRARHVTGNTWIVYRVA